MNLVGARVDALTVAFRVELAEEFLERLRERRKHARRHGRAAFRWEAPPELRARGRAPGDVGAVWRHLAEDRPIVGELSGMGKGNQHHIKREPAEQSSVGYRILVREHGPGGFRYVSDVTGEVVEEPGWTVEVVWYAETLATWGLDRCLAESAAMAWQMGKVHEQALWRLDLCADVAGWEIHPDDAAAILRRPRARYDVASDARELGELISRRSRRRRGPVRADEARGVTTHEAGKPGERRVCGLSIGYGGATVARIYNKVLELSLAGRERKRALEYAQWRDRGWDEEAPVTRVEFQLKSGALKEFGLRDPEAVRETVVDETTGKARGQTIAYRADGRPMTLSERLPWLWSTMLRWVRLVVPDPTQRHACRLETQWRWRFLEVVTLGALPPLKRCRVRGKASEAQALGVALGNAAKAGELDAVPWAVDERWEEPAMYPRERAQDILEERVRALSRLQHARIVAWLLERAKGDPVDACVHLATVASAKRSRHAADVEFEVELREREARPPPVEAPPSRGDPFAHWSAGFSASE